MFIKENILYSYCIIEERDWVKIVYCILCGDVVFFIDGIDRCFLIFVCGWELCGIEELNIEVVVRGLREGFIENLRINIVFIRRKICDLKFKIELIKIGKIFKIDVVICYIEFIVKKEFVDEVKRCFE